MNSALIPQRTSSLRQNSLWALGSQGLKLILQAGYFVLIGRALGSHQYGAFIGVASMVAVLAQFATWGSGMMMLRSVSISRESFPRAWGAALLSTAFISLLLSLAACASARLFFSAQVAAVVPWIAFSDIICAKGVELSSQAFQAFHRLRDTARLTVLSSAIRLAAAAMLFALHHGQTVDALAWSKLYAVASLCGALLALILVTQQLGPPQFAAIPRSHWWEGFGFSVAYSTTSIYNDLDKAMLASRGLLQAAGIYGSAYRVIDIACTPISAIHAAAMPHLFASGREGVAAVSGLVRKLLSRTLLYAAAAGALLAAGAPCFALIMGASFRESVPVIRWLCLLPLLRALHLTAGDGLTALNAQWRRTSSQVFAAFLNLLLNLALIPRLSWKGAAIASLLTDGSLALANWVMFAHLTRGRHEAAGQIRETTLAIEST